jgi:hypothetical protein
MDLTPFPASVRALLRPEHLPELGPGRPNAPARSALEAMTAESLFGSKVVRHPELVQCCQAGLWLLHDFFDESHAISQDIETPEGSYWHGILHRREPDYGNAAYWFRRVRNHAVFATLRTVAATLAQEAGTPAGGEFLTRQSAWDPFAFIDLCQSVASGRTPCELLCRKIQRAEWDALFTYCYEQATTSL